MMLSLRTITTTMTAFVAFASCGLALAEPLVTAAAAVQLVPRATDPAFVGYISASGGYSDARSCDYPQTVSTSGSYVQCCPTTGACPFYTACSSNTLLAAGTAVPCDVNTALTCNTGIVESTAGAAGGPSYLACWQTSLGAGAFTFVQDIGSASAAAPTGTTSAAASGNTAHSSSGATTSSSSGSHTSTSSRASTSGSTSASAATASASSSNAAVILGAEAGIGGGIVGGVLALLAQMLL